MLITAAVDYDVTVSDSMGNECQSSVKENAAVDSQVVRRVRISMKKRREQTMLESEARVSAARQDWKAALKKHGKDGREDMGDIERSIRRNGRELQRAELERILQQRADDTPNVCPDCGAELKQLKWRSMTILSAFGPVTISRVYGYCQSCAKWVAPADTTLALEGEGTNSPEMSEQLRLLGTLVPPGHVEALSQKLYGFEVDELRVARELERGGREALEERKRQDERALCTEGRHEVTREIAPLLPREPFVMIIQADGFMVRERDAWGQTKSIREQGGRPERWHEVKAGTIFLLNDRADTGGGNARPMIVQRGYVSTREGAFEFGQQLYAEAIRRGLLRASKVYFIADGGIWLWNIFADRFKGAKGTLDFYHAAEHLWAIAHAQYGQGSEEASNWARPLIHQLRHGGEAGVVETLEDLAAIVEEMPLEQRSEEQQAILRDANYFAGHRQHLHYAENSANGLPIGSGCIESTCKQYQVRVKRSGQFWLRDHMEGLLCLYSRWLSRRWNWQN